MDQIENKEKSAGKKPLSVGCIIMLVGVAIFLVAIIMRVAFDLVATSFELIVASGNLIAAGVVVFLVGGVVLNAEANSHEKEERKRLEKDHACKREIAKIKYGEVCVALNKPDHVETLMLKSMKAKLKEKYGQRAIYLDLWFEDNELIFVMTQKCAIGSMLFAAKQALASELNADDLKDYIYTKKIPVQNIKFYQKNGDIQREVKITGGGGGGSSIEGAVVGGLIAGGAGAVVGSRKKIDPIQSETIVHDEREVVLYYYENQNDTMLQKMTFFEDAYKIFLSWIPEKEYQAVNASVKPEIKEQVPAEPIKQAETVTDTLASELLELVKLKESGILTEEEFVLAKKKVLEKS